MADSPRRENDASYRNIFNHASMIEWLLRRYVAQPWIERLDISTLEPVKAHFVGPENQQRESDLIWRAKLRDCHEWFYVYVLVEFQSTPDRFMAVRVLAYLCLLYEDLIRQKTLLRSDILPPVLPIVLYNGARRWTMPVQIRDLIEPINGGLDSLVPRFEYLVIDEGHLPREALEPLDNPVTAVFQLEQARSVDDVRRLVAELTSLLEGPDMKGPRRDMVTWLRRVILPVMFPGETFPELQELKEARDMLAERVKQWPKEWMAEGRREGLEEGLQQGRQEGRQEGLSLGRVEGLRTSLKLQLELKFGELRPEILEQLHGSNEKELVLGLQRLLSVDSIDDVF